MVARTLLLRAAGSVRPHVPLIKFRKGGAAAASSADTGAKGNPAGAAAAPPQKQQQAAPHPAPKSAVCLPTIEDYQLPPKYRRTPLSEAEIAYINRGGPE